MLTTTQQQQILEQKKLHGIYAPLANKTLFHAIIDALAEPFIDTHIDKVICPEARGFLLGSAVAYTLNAGCVVIRKEGKMFPEYTKDLVYSTTYYDYSHKEKTIEVEKSEHILLPHERVLLVDDWFETGGSGHASIKLLEEAQTDIIGISVMLDDMSDEVRQSFSAYNFHGLVKTH